MAELLIDAGADLNRVDELGRTPLMLAASSGNMEMVRMLLQAEASAAVVDRSGNTALTYAAHAEHGQIALMLLPACYDRKCDTPLTWATRCGYRSLVFSLLERGEDVNATNRNRKTPLICAAQDGHVDIVRMLLRYGADVNARDSHGQTALLCAAKKAAWPDIEHPLLSSYQWIVEELLTRPGIDVNAGSRNGYTPLIVAHGFGAGIYKALIERGANVNALTGGGLSAYDYAPPEARRLLRDAGARGQEVLNDAARDGDLQLVRDCLDSGVDVNPEITWRYQKTPLMIAAENGKSEVVRLLLRCGAEATGRAPYGSLDVGQYPLALAAEQGQIDTVRLLLDSGGDPNVALTAAAKGGSCEIIRFAISRGAKIKKAESAVEAAFDHGHADAVRLLADLGAKLPRSSWRSKHTST